MAQYMLDTNMCIYLMKNQPEQVAMHFANCSVGDVVMSAITYAELEYGVTVAANRTRERRNLNSLIKDIPVLSFDDEAAKAYGPIRATSGGRRKDQLDKLIAAHAIALNIILVTNNERDFHVYPGIKIENWIKD
ncbi:tRNA(fMet)-specific endonuclease VapC [Oxalobacteraceae bacterium GrIS 2.11]